MPRSSRSTRNRPLPLQIKGNGRHTEKLEHLKAHIRQLEGFNGAFATEKRKVIPFGIEKIDSRLPGGGLQRGALHEIFAADVGIATAFCALLAGRLVKESQNQSILWCERPRTLDAGILYGPAFLQFGVNPEKLILVKARRDQDVLWAMEESLQCNQISAVVGELTNISLTASRRLQLAAESVGVTAFILRPKSDKPPPSAATTRWRLGTVSHEQDLNTTLGSAKKNYNLKANIPGLGSSRWKADMLRCRGGTSSNWMMEWKNETGDFSVATELRDRSFMSHTTRLA